MATKKLEVLITGNSAGAQHALSSVSKSAGGMSSQFSKFAKVTSAAFLVGGAAAIAFAKKSADTYQRVGTETLKLQKYTGQSAEEASKLRFAFQQTGVPIDKASQVLGIFSKKISASKDGMADFGIQTRDVNGNVKPMNVLLGEAADKFNSMAPGAERTAWVMKTFGKSGMDMTKFLSLGSKGMAELTAEAEKYGLVLTDSNLGAVKDAIKGHREQTAAMEGLQVQIGQHVLPLITKMTTFVAAEIPKMTKFVKDHADAFKALGVVVAVTAAGFAAYKVAAVASTVATGAWTVATTVAAAAQAVMALGLDGLALSAMYAMEALAPMVAVALPIAAAVGAFAYQMNQAKKEAQAFQAGVDHLRQTMDQLGVSAKDAALEDLPETFAANSDVFEKAGFSITDVGTALKGTRAEYEAWRDAHQGDPGDLENQAAIGAIDALRGQYEQAQMDAYNLAHSKKALADASEEEAASTKEAWDALVMHEAAVNADWDALNKLQNLKMGALNANIAYLQAVEDETQAFKENGATIDISTAKGRANTQAAMASRQAIMQQAEALKKNGATASTIAKFISEHTAQLGRQERAAGLSADQVAFLNHEMGLTPRDIASTFHVYTQGALTALSQLSNYANQVANDISTAVAGAVNIGSGRRSLGAGGGKSLTTGPKSLRLAESFATSRGGLLTDAQTSAGRGGTEVIQIVLDGKVVAESTRNHAIAHQRVTGRTWVPAPA